ncbi:tyrosine kinase receptor Cad96Ca-like [Ptychodera flava]|uniref:tyrosine kinase receptor Cad96Ca-like n=1 Tax=Ptychodera flava TaxID=63121 RepID=UPI00396A8D7E
MTTEESASTTEHETTETLERSTTEGHILTSLLIKTTQDRTTQRETTTQPAIRTSPSPTTSKLAETTGAESTTRKITTPTDKLQTTRGRTTTDEQRSTALPTKLNTNTSTQYYTTIDRTQQSSTTSSLGGPGPESDSNIALIVTVSLLGVAVVVIIILGVLYFRRRHTDAGGVVDAEVGSNEVLTIENLGLRGLPRVSSMHDKFSTKRDGTVKQVDDLKRRSMHFNRGNLALGDVIGKGSYTQVMSGQAWKVIDDQSISKVAIKMLRDDAREVDKARLLSELETMRKLLDPPCNIISLLGHCQDEDPIYIIYEFAEQGNLQSYLREVKEEYFGDDTQGDSSKYSEILLRFCEEIGQGLAYLHSMNVVHGDLCSLSIHVTDDLVIKLSDIGKQPTNRSGKSSTFGKRSLAIRWMAPEAHRGEGNYKSDIWAYAVVMWELVTLGATPYFQMAWGEEVKNYVKEGGRLEKPEHCSQEFYNTMSKCWADDFKQRPIAKAVVKKIQQFNGSELDHINMAEFDANRYQVLKSPSKEEKF